MNECQEQLKVCQASCCKCFTFNTGLLTNDMIHYYELHGCEVKRVKRDKYKVIVKVRCQALTSRLQCNLWGRPERPAVCRYFTQETAYTDNVHITEGCKFKK